VSPPPFGSRSLRSGALFSRFGNEKPVKLANPPPLNNLVRAFLVKLRILLFCGYVLAFFTLFLDALGPSRRAPLCEAQQHGVRWRMRKATRDNGASSSKRVGSQRGLSRKFIELLNSVVSTRSYQVAHSVPRYCKDQDPCDWRVDAIEKNKIGAPLLRPSSYGSGEWKN